MEQKSIEEQLEIMLHNLVETTDDTLTLFKNQMAKLSEADAVYYVAYLKRKFQEEGIASMIEHYYRDASEESILIKKPSFPVDVFDKNEIDRRNDIFIKEKISQLIDIKISLPLTPQPPIQPEPLPEPIEKKVVKSSSDIYSYEWKHKSEDDGIKMLHALLKKTKPEIISHKTNLSTFRKAFKNIQLTEKNKLSIIWCVKGPNNKITKQSLFYFLHQLDMAGFIVFKHPNTIPYIFVDKEGNPIKNIDVSQSTGSKNPTRKADIDELITKLKNKLNPNT